MPVQTVVGQLAELWRYPVKSMLGEELDWAFVSERGVSGDRVYALVDAETGKVASAKNPKLWRRLFECRAALADTPQAAGEPPPVTITVSGGATVSSEDPDVDELLSRMVGRRVTLEHKAPKKPVLEEYWPDIAGVSSDGDRDTVTDERIGEPRGTFFDAAPIHVLTTATLHHLGTLYPQGRFDVRRFRPNVVVRTENAGEFVENDWLGRAIRIGAVTLPLMGAVPRCVMTTLAQDDLPHDHGILRAAAQHNRVKVAGHGQAACVGIYSGVGAGGTITRGDEVSLS